MQIKLSELRQIVREFPPAQHAGERRIGVLYPPPDIEALKRGTYKDSSFEEFIFESVAFYRPGGYHYEYRWKLVTPVEIEFDNER